MKVEVSDLLSAGQIEPGERFYVVVLAKNHPTLKVGDVVRMCEYKTNNLFVRYDATIHDIQVDGQYVIVVPEMRHYT